MPIIDLQIAICDRCRNTETFEYKLQPLHYLLSIDWEFNHTDDGELEIVCTKCVRRENAEKTK